MIAGNKSEYRKFKRKTSSLNRIKSTNKNKD